MKFMAGLKALGWDL